MEKTKTFCLIPNLLKQSINTITDREYFKRLSTDPP